MMSDEEFAEWLTKEKARAFDLYFHAMNCGEDAQMIMAEAKRRIETEIVKRERRDR